MEVLAPAGSPEALVAAVQSGADAVYFGSKRFSARKAAVNFDDEEMRQAVAYCHIRGVKAYLALNTVLTNSELPAARALLREAAACGVDAVILCDLAVAQMARELGLKLHASTQMTVHSLEGVQYLERLGFSRVVLARECTGKEIAEIAAHCKAEIEVFVHGALCVCYSGQCLMSSMIGGRSGNRGGCAQPCRLPYEYGGKTGYFLSTRDLCLLEELDELKRMGVQSVKIEGRMKSSAYVAAVTEVYSRYAKEGGPVDPADLERLKGSFCRGGAFSKGWYYGEKGAAMMHHGSNDKVLQSSDRQVLDEAKKRALGGEHCSVPVSFTFSAAIGETPLLTCTDGVHTATVAGLCKAEAAKNLALDEERICQQLSKTGGTPYVPEQITCKVEPGLSLPLREVNDLRRRALEALSAQRAGTRVVPPSSVPEAYFARPPKPDKLRLYASVETAEQAQALIEAGIERLYLPPELYDNIEFTDKVLYLPTIMKTAPTVKAPAVLASNMAHFQLAGQESSRIIGDYRLNVFNSMAANLAACDEITLSAELTLAQMKEAAAHCSKPCEAVIYGYLPLMLSNHCVIQSLSGCKKSGCSIDLTDRTKAVFAVKGKDCVNILYNSRPLFMADKMKALAQAGLAAGRLVFTNETPAECRAVLRMYQGKDEAVLPGRFTRGHFYDKKDRMV